MSISAQKMHKAAGSYHVYGKQLVLETRHYASIVNRELAS
jgi:hypothetical protein